MAVHRRPIECFDKDGRLIGSWNSVLQASEQSGCSHTVIKRCAGCERRTECQFCAYFRKYRRTWRYTEEA